MIIRKSYADRIFTNFNRIWFEIRKVIVIRRHAKVAKLWEDILNEFLSGNLDYFNTPPKKKIDGPVIWQYWDEDVDFDSLPPVVQRCFISVDRYRGNCQVIRLNDNNISDYLDLPNYINGKDGKPKFSKVFFSDLLRLGLLKTYGGIWLDATVLLTKPISTDELEFDHFVFQRDDNVEDKSFWEGPHTAYWSWNPSYRVKMLNSIIYAKEDSVLISTMFTLILHFWKTQHRITDYFFFQILYDKLINENFIDLKPPIVSDTLPHVLRVLIYGGEYEVSLRELFFNIGMHKLTYLDPGKIVKLDGYIDLSNRLHTSEPTLSNLQQKRPS